jgi:arylsulfatase A-like enzyme
VTLENVLLVTVDSLRYDSTAPAETLRSLGETGEWFEQAYATGPGTTPSFPAMLTGTLPLSYNGLGPLSDDRPRVAAELRAAGLRTGGFQCNPFLSTYFGYDHGFDRFEDYQNPLMGVATRIFPRGIELNNKKLKQADEILGVTDAIKWAYRVVAGKPRPYVSAEVITNDVLAFLEETDIPFFCWTHYMDVHHPCHPPVSYRERFGVGDVTQTKVSEWYSALLREPETLSEAEIDAMERLYDASVAYTDDQFARIIDTLRRQGRFEDTLVVITSDHGELFGDHGEYGKPERLYDELLRVPLVICNGPQSLSEMTDNLVSLLDLPPLFHDALGLDVPEVYTGRRLGADEPRKYVCAEHEVEGNVVVGARSRQWRYTIDEIDGDRRLVNLMTGERVNSDEEPDASQLVREAVNRRLSELNVGAEFLQGDVNDAVADRLEELGYL